MKQLRVLDSLSEDSPGVLHFDGRRVALFELRDGFWAIRRQMESLMGFRLANSVLQQAGANGGAAFAESWGRANDTEDQKRFFDLSVQAYQSAGFGRFVVKDATWPIGRVVIQARDGFEAWTAQHHGQPIDGPVCAYTAGVLVGFINAICDRRDVVCIEHCCQALGAQVCEFELLPASRSDDRTPVGFATNPSLGRQLNLLEMMFERMPMGILMLDREYHVQRYNTTWREFSARYAPPAAAPLSPGVYYFDHLPGSESLVTPLFERVLSGETIRQNALRFESGGIVSYWDVVLAPIMEHGEVNGILNVTNDATERVQLHQTLEQSVNERTRELQMLLDIAAAANSSPDLDETLRSTLDLLIDLIAASRAGVMLCGEGDGKLEARMFRPEQSVSTGELEKIVLASETVVASGKPLYIMPDAEQGFVEPNAFLPLGVRDRILGVLMITGSDAVRFEQQHMALCKSIADQLGIALENARLYGQVEHAAIATERNRLARDLHDAVTQTLFSASLIAEVLPKLWELKPEAGRQKVEELRQLTRGALSEMRTLLLELRPATLVEMDLGDLLRYLAEAFTGRTLIPAALTVEGQGDPPEKVKDVFYRVAQEALNNVYKHAEATQVCIHLKRKEKQLELKIGDNGRGFDSQTIPPQSLGLGIMRERASEIGAQLGVQSQIGSGTDIRLLWKEGQE